MNRFRFYFAFTSVLCLAGWNTAAQTVEQVWPPDSAGALSDVVIWDDSTIIAFGANDAILQSDDGGNHWEKVRWGNGEWNFYRAVKTGQRIVLLAQAAIEQRALYPEGRNIRLIEYDPVQRSLKMHSFPFFYHPVETAYTETVDDTLFLLAEDGHDAATLAWTANLGSTWDTIPLPAKEYQIREASFFCRDTRHIGFIMRDAEAHFALYLSEDGGIHWRKCDNLLLDTYRHYHASYLAGAGAQWTRDNTIIVTSRKSKYDSENYYFTVSKDGGRSWQQRAKRPYDPVVVRALDSSTVCYTDLLRKVYLSEDGCRSFRVIAAGSHLESAQFGNNLSNHFDDWATGLSLDGAGRIAVCDRRGNLGFTSNTGETWKQVRRSILDLKNFHMFDDSLGMLEARDITTDRISLYRTTDGGRDWTAVFALDSSGFAGLRHQTPTLSFAVPANVRPDSTAVFRSIDGGRSWTSVAKDETRWGPYSFLSTEQDSNFVGVLTGSHVLITSDAGATWKRMDRYSGDRLYWLGRSGFAWLSGGDGLYLSYLDMRYGYWNQKHKILDWSGSPLMLQVFSNLEACAVACYKAFYTSTGGELWKQADAFDCYSYRAWSVRDGRGSKLHPIEDAGYSYFWHYDAVHTTTDHWQSEDLQKIWYTGDLYMSGNYHWSSPPTSPHQYILTNHHILRVTIDAVSGVEPRPDHTASLIIDTPNPHPVSAGDVTEIGVRCADGPHEAQLEVFDLKGSRVCAVPLASSGDEKQRFVWNTGDISPGVYLLRATAGAFSATRLIVVQ